MKYLTNRRINVRTIRNIKENEGLTLRNGKIVEYKTGWQVGITGITCKAFDLFLVLRGISCRAKRIFESIFCFC